MKESQYFKLPTCFNTATGQRKAKAVLTCWRPVQRLCNINHVDNDRLDSIPFAFNLEAQQQGTGSNTIQRGSMVGTSLRKVTLAIRRGIL